MNPIESEVIAIVAATLHMERSGITLEASLEDRFAVDIPDEDAAELRTVKQVTDYVALALDAHVPLQKPSAA